MEENSSPEPKVLGGKPQTLPNAGDERTSRELLFYNVMPKKNTSGAVIDPTVTVAAEAGGQEEVSSDLAKLFSKYKRYIFMGLGVLVLAGAGYFAYSKFVSNSNNLVNLPVPVKHVVKHDDTSAQNASSTATTSKEWQMRYFNSETCVKVEVCGDSADPDLDGLTNLEEFKAGTDPNNKDSDSDGLSDGDEVRVFGTDPLNAHTGKDASYNDADFIKGGYSVATGKKMTSGEISELSKKMNQYSLHQPTLTTLKDVLVSIYNFGVEATPSNNASSTPTSTATSSPLSGFDLSVEAKADRDAQRSATIKNIETALVKYQTDHATYPIGTSFTDMYSKIKVYLKVASNPSDPVNKDPYVYSYSSGQDGKDFTVSFYSEVAGQVIKKHAADAVKDASLEQANMYDDRRRNDLQSLQSGLQLYSNQNIAGNQQYVFPTEDKYKTALVPTYITQIPKDPKTGTNYEYKVSATFDTFTLKAVLDNPAPGTTGYLCNQEECRAY